jgi:phage gp45-like
MQHKFNPRQSQVDRFTDAIPFIMEGQVVDTADPDQMGRVKVWVTALDGEDFDIDHLPWADYASPFMGFTVEYPGGNGSSTNTSHASYGFWAIPKLGSTVLVFCLNGDPTSRCFFASTVRLHRNRSLPAGRNTDPNGNPGPWGDAGDGKGNLNPIQPAFNNLRTQFNGKVTQSEAITRGTYERAVAQPKTDKDGTEGYSTSPADPSYLDPQTYCIVTPGRNAIIMQDNPKYSRMRLKTAEGHQIIFDDANERIYVSTSKGNSWVELDQDGHINIYGSDSISIRSGKDINFFADNNINLEAVNAVNIKADKSNISLNCGGTYQVLAAQNILLSACGIFDVNATGTMHLTTAASLEARGNQGVAITGDSTIDLKAGGALTASASIINLNGPAARTATSATCAAQAGSPSIVPGFEPWTRPASSAARGTNWKP